MAIGNRAAALDALDRMDEAEAEYVRCADMLKELGENELRAEVFKALSALQLRSGRQLEALGSMKGPGTRPSPRPSKHKSSMTSACATCSASRSARPPASSNRYRGRPRPFL